MAKRTFQAHDPIESDRAYRFRTLNTITVVPCCSRMVQPPTKHDLSQFMHSPSCKVSQLDRGMGRGVPANELRFEEWAPPRRESTGGDDDMNASRGQCSAVAAFGSWLLASPYGRCQPTYSMLVAFTPQAAA